MVEDRKKPVQSADTLNKLERKKKTSIVGMLIWAIAAPTYFFVARVILDDVLSAGDWEIVMQILQYYDVIRFVPFSIFLLLFVICLIQVILIGNKINQLKYPGQIPASGIATVDRGVPVPADGQVRSGSQTVSRPSQTSMNAQSASKSLAGVPEPKEMNASKDPLVGFVTSPCGACFPSMCVGCGEKDLQKLHEHDYSARFERETGRSYGSSTVTINYRVTTIGLRNYVCIDCEARARAKYFGFAVLFIAFLTASLVIFGLAEQDIIPFEIIIAGGIGMALFIPLTIWWLVFRFNAARHFVKVWMSPFGSTFTFYLKNPAIGEIFKRLNPNLHVKMWTWFL